MDAQVRLTFASLDAVLAVAGCMFHDVADADIFLVDPGRHFARAWEVVAVLSSELPHPTATVVGVTQLSGFRFEFKVVATLPEGRAGCNQPSARTRPCRPVLLACRRRPPQEDAPC